LLVEWLRWIAEFRADLGALTVELECFGYDLEASAEFYEREAQWLLDQLTEDAPFSHRLLSKSQCEALYQERRELLLTELDAGTVLPLSRSLEHDPGALRPLQHPLNHRFPKLDGALDRTAAAVFGDWLACDVEAVLLDDAEVCARALPANRLRALADAARPLARPEGGIAVPARADLQLLPRQEDASRIPAIYQEAIEAAAELADGHDPGRLSIRSVLHGFPALSLAQLRPIRERAVSAGVLLDEGGDPLPAAVLVNAEQRDVIALGLAFERIRREGSGIFLAELEIVADEAALAHQFASTFAGSRAYECLRERLADDLAALDGLDRLRAAVVVEPGSGLVHRESLRRLLEELEDDRWPDSLPLRERE
jgi:hypothetical protein